MVTKPFEWFILRLGFLGPFGARGGVVFMTAEFAPVNPPEKLNAREVEFPTRNFFVKK